MTQNLRLSLLGCVLLLTSLLVSAQSSTSTPYDLFDVLPASWQQGRSAVNLAVERPSDATMVRLNTKEFSTLRAADLDAFELTLPLPGGDRDHVVEPLTFQLERFFVHPAVVTVGMTSDRGYKRKSTSHLADLSPCAPRRPGGHADVDERPRAWQLPPQRSAIRFGTRRRRRVRCVGFQQANQPHPFECGLRKRRRPRCPQVQMEQRMDGGCVEVAIDVDNFTYLTYNNMSNATDWALAQMAGVSAIYTQELNGLVLLQASYVHLWQTPTPWPTSSTTQVACWTAFEHMGRHSKLDAVQRDVTHLMSKRGNTGTGGIAWLSNCSSFAYGFSSAMSGARAPTSTATLGTWTVAHELGHNFGANHTHWCGWPGEPLTTATAQKVDAATVLQSARVPS